VANLGEADTSNYNTRKFPYATRMGMVLGLSHRATARMINAMMKDLYGDKLVESHLVSHTKVANLEKSLGQDDIKEHEEEFTQLKSIGVEKRSKVLLQHCQQSVEDKHTMI